LVRGDREIPVFRFSEVRTIEGMRQEKSNS
jgi:hypothetical protein